VTAIDSAAEPAAEREVVITRVIDAPAKFLFLAWTRPEYVQRWFGPKGWPLTTCEMDFRVGGKFRFGMTGPDGVAGPLFGGEYLEIVPNKKIVYDNGFDGAPKMVVTVTYDELAAARTRLTIHTLFATVAMKNQHLGYGYAEGIESGLDQYVDFVAELQVRERT
jgi:uncharacterized protein YndB with AHSA1/START domain